jgi:hypothetical protein
MMFGGVGLGGARDGESSPWPVRWLLISEGSG